MSLVYFIGPIGMSFGFVFMGGFIASGTWWMPFMFNSVILLFMVPVFGQLDAVPSKLTSGMQNQVVPEAEAAGKKSSGRSQTRHMSSLITEEAKEKIAEFHQAETFWSVSKSILTDRIWIFAAIGCAMEWFATAAYSNTGPQFVESVLGVHPSSASVLAGVVIVPGAALGTILGGIIDSKRHKNLCSTAFFNVKCAFTACIFMLAMMFINCQQAEVVGLDSDNFFTGGCGDNTCGCSQQYSPICVANVTYFNPCVAGCTEWGSKADIAEMTPQQQEELYDTCTCANSATGLDFAAEDDPVLSDGLCSSQQCKQLGTFLLLFFCGIFFTFMNATPASVVICRVIPTHHSAISLSLSDIINKLLGTIPGPLFFGALMDTSCLVKSIVLDGITCESRESCALFENSRLLQHLAISLTLVFKSISMLFAGMCYMGLRGTKEGEQLYSDTVNDGHEDDDHKGFRKLELKVEVVVESEKESGNEGKKAAVGLGQGSTGAGNVKPFRKRSIAKA